MTSTHETASFSLLPPELALAVLAHSLPDEASPQSALARFVRVNRACHDLATPLLYASPCATSLDSLESLVAAVTARAPAGHAHDVRALRVAGRVFASKGWGVRVGKALKACAGVERLELVGVDDLRAKHLVGEGALTHLSLLNSSFAAHSLPSPPTLVPFLSSLTHLTLANVGLPHPSTHLTDMLSICAPHLEFLALSSLRDVEERQFRRAMAVLVRQAGRLKSVKLGFLLDEQVRAMCAPLLVEDDAASFPTPPPSPTSPPAAAADPAAPALSLLPSVTHLSFTLPLPTSALLLALPTALEILTVRPPYSRPSSSNPTPGGARGTPTIFGTSRESLLRVLDRRPAPAPLPDGPHAAAHTATPTPFATPARERSQPGQARRPSFFTLEQLEEEERVVVALEDALEVRPGENGRGPVSMVAPRLREVRWEGRALRSARARVAEVLARRDRVRERGAAGV
ncbi:hypothetical protein JCM3775_002362 [Rhodotorula graminis]